jgi:hypothetical protein
VLWHLLQVGTPGAPCVNPDPKFLLPVHLSSFQQQQLAGPLLLCLDFDYCYGNSGT